MYSGIDESSGMEYYYSSVTGVSMWVLPSFMYPKQNPLLESELSEESGSERGVFVESEEHPLEDPSLDSTHIVIRERRYPRSKAQAIVDEAEDSQLAELDLSGLGLERVSSRVFDLMHLRSLDLSKNRLSSLSPDIQYLHNLTRLTLCHNRLEKIPVEIEELEKLQSFDASHNRLTSLPGHFFKLKDLKELYLSGNPFVVVPMEVGSLELLKELREWEVSIGCLTKLEVLCMDHCALSEWPKQLERLIHLNKLDLSRNEITSISENISSNVSLREVNMSYNYLYHFPTEIYSLKLEKLNLSYNRIAHLAIHDEKRQYSIRKHLTLLDISHNELQELGSQLGLFYRLITLNASHNIVANIHDSISSLLYLTSLDLSHNLLNKLPSALRTCSALIDLNLSYNRFESFPLVLNSLTSLKHLNLSYNSIVTVLDDSIQNFVVLQTLDLSYNQLTKIPDSISYLQQIQDLDLSSNKILAICDSLGSLTTLKQLYLSANKIHELPASMCSAQALKTLDVKSNCLSGLPSQFLKLSQLRSFDCSRNKFTSIPSITLAQLPLLQHWDFSWNPIRTVANDASTPEFETESIQPAVCSSIRADMGSLLQDLEDEIRRPMVGIIEQSKTPLFLNEKLEREWNEEQSRLKASLDRDITSIVEYHRALAVSMSMSDAHIVISVDDEWASVANLGVAVHHIIQGFERLRSVLYSTVIQPNNDFGALLFAEDLNCMHYSYLLSVLECYGHLGQAILHRCQLLGLSIRAFEKQGGLASRLDVSQRIGLDYFDLIHDMVGDISNILQPENRNSKNRRSSLQSIQKSFELLSMENTGGANNLNQNDIVTGIDVMLNLRITLLARARIVLCAAADILRSHGWDPRSHLFVKGEGTVPNECKEMKQIAAKIYFILGRVYQALGDFDMAISKFNCVVVMFPIWTASKFEIVRSSLAAGRWQAAINTIDEICYKDYQCVISDQFTIADLLHKNRELAVLLLLAQGCQRELSKISRNGRGLFHPHMDISDFVHTLPHDSMMGRPRDYVNLRNKQKIAAETVEKINSMESRNDNLFRRCDHLRKKAFRLTEEAENAIQ